MTESEITLEEFERVASRYIEPTELRLERTTAQRGKEQVAIVDGAGREILKLELPGGVVDVEDERWLIARAERIRSIAKTALRLVG